MLQGTNSLLPRLRHQWPRIVIATLSLYYLFYSVQNAFRSLTSPPSTYCEQQQQYHGILLLWLSDFCFQQYPSNPTRLLFSHSFSIVIELIHVVHYRSIEMRSNVSRVSYFMYFYMLLKVAIGLQRVHVAVSKPSTGIVQFAFNVWLVGTLAYGTFKIHAYSAVYFVPSLIERANNTFALHHNLTSNEFLQQSTTTTATTTPALIITLWRAIEPWVPSALNMLLGIALWTILNRKQQFDHEQEIRQEQQGHSLLTGTSGLPAPVASASTVEGFMTEAEIRQSRLRVPTWPRLFVGTWHLMRTIDGVRHLFRLSGKEQRGKSF